MSQALSTPTAEDLCSVHAPPEQTRAESRTRWVVALTAVMMVAELIVGRMTGSLALTADGWHMATHVGALGLSALAYWYARTRAKETAFAFGTGRVYALSGYSSAAFLLAIAVWVVWESIHRLISPEAVLFREAMPVAVIGLVVNLASAWLLSGSHDHSHHDHAHGDHDHAHHHHHDHNLKAAYLHVIADALTSVLAIVALLCGEYLQWNWVDPVVGLVGSALILQWGVKLLRDCARQLIDLDPSTRTRDAVRAAIEKIPGTRIADLHLWHVGPGKQVCVIALESSSPRPLAEYQDAAMKAVKLAHLTIEVRTVASA